MFFLKASLKALVNLTNIPCFQPKEKNFNPKGNRKAKRELFLDKSPSSVPSPLGPGGNLESQPQLCEAAGDRHRAPRAKHRLGTPGTVCTVPGLSRARIRPGTDL